VTAPLNVLINTIGAVEELGRLDEIDTRFNPRRSLGNESPLR
jgi:hypothetical protein